MKRWLRPSGLNRRGPKITASGLRSTFDRRAMVIGTLQGGIDVLLAVRMGYLARNTGSNPKAIGSIFR